MIRLKCINEKCGFSYEISENEIKEYGQYHTKCLICGSKLEIAKESLEKIINTDLETKIKENIDKWVKKFGWDYVIDLVKKYKDYYAVGRLYVEELKRRGFNIKGE
jgi:hypothetical protein